MMEKTKHTPGPWAFEWENDTGPEDDYYRQWWEINGPDGEKIAEVDLLKDARLIAAAPCLIEALRECITGDGAACLQNGSVVALFRRLQTINAIARTALAKARGE